MVRIMSVEPTQEEEERLRETKSRDAKALFILQQTVHEVVFYRIVTTTTLKEVWSILQMKFQGGSKVIVVKLQALRHDYETLCSKSLFQELDEMQKIHVQLGNKKEMQVEGKGTVGINIDCDGKEEDIDTSLGIDSSTTTTNASVSVTPSRDSSSSTTLEEYSEETPSRKYRSLIGIYASCQFALTVLDPIHYEEAAKQEEWQRALMEEMNAIEKNGT
ncbi:hypothetical protein V6N11_051094 [Hibiscus sabdariffa]|uniref:Uncharacterized protein n=1 Tax=Hibiscus sabdariffa TaxID=183260 RepID=A0ABR2R3B1_9ROSI